MHSHNQRGGIIHSGQSVDVCREAVRGDTKRDDYDLGTSRAAVKNDLDLKGRWL